MGRDVGMTGRLILYTTSGCHLCEDAELMLRELQRRGHFEVEPVDIAGDESLVERYGIRIPVVVNAADGRELGWPFSPEQLLDLGAPAPPP